MWRTGSWRGALPTTRMSDAPAQGVLAGGEPQVTGIGGLCWVTTAVPQHGLTTLHNPRTFTPNSLP